jgi:hypothetical protein
VCKRVLGYQGVEAGLWVLRCYYASYYSRGELQILKSCPADARTLQSGSCTHSCLELNLDASLDVCAMKLGATTNRSPGKKKNGQPTSATVRKLY